MTISIFRGEWNRGSENGLPEADVAAKILRSEGAKVDVYDTPIGAGSAVAYDGEGQLLQRLWPDFFKPEEKTFIDWESFGNE